MNYKDTWSWPNIPVDEVDREDIETCYSFGHYDGPGTGLILWEDQHWYVTRFEYDDARYWIIQLTPEEQEYALQYGKTWADFFHQGMRWNPDGSHRKQKDGLYAHRPTPNHLTMTDEGRARFKELFPKRPEPSQTAEVVGWFKGWRI